MYKIYKVPDDAADLFEQLGTKRKFWYNGPDGQLILFKEGRPGTGENWSEIVAAGICSLLNIPHAEYDFAEWRDLYGTISPSFVPPDGRLILGNELFAKLIQGYDVKKFYKQKQYVLKRLFAILDNDIVKLPIGWVPLPNINSAAEVFVGYLMLDALIANQDRHHENWGLIATSDNQVHLTPIYDNASGLGRIETDENRKEMLLTKDKRRHITSYVQRARSAFYLNPNSAKVMSSLEAFIEAQRIYPVAAEVWLLQLEQLDVKLIQSYFNQIPVGYITQNAIDFATELIVLNRNRLLELYRG